MLVNTGFQVLFHSPPGVLFTFPSRYFFSIGHQAVFRLRGWSPFLPRGFLVPTRTPDPGSLASSVAYMTLTFFGRLSHTVPLDSLRFLPVLTPDAFLLPVWPPPLSLAATYGISF